MCGGKPSKYYFHNGSVWPDSKMSGFNGNIGPFELLSQDEPAGMRIDFDQNIITCKINPFFLLNPIPIKSYENQKKQPQALPEKHFAWPAGCRSFIR